MIWLWCARRHLGAASGHRPAPRSATRSTGWSTAPGARRRGAAVGGVGRRACSRCSRRDRGASPLLRVVAPCGCRVALLVDLASTSAGVGRARRVVERSSPPRSRLSAPVAQAAGERARLRRRAALPAAHPARRCSSARSRSRSLLIAAGVSVGPLLLADGRYVAGAVATVVGLPIAVAARAVAAPAVVPLVRARARGHRRRRSAHAHRPGARAPRADRVVRRDARRAPDRRRRRSTSGSARSPGTIAISLREPQSFARRRGRRDAEMHDADVVLVSPRARRRALAQAPRAAASRSPEPAARTHSATMPPPQQHVAVVERDDLAGRDPRLRRRRSTRSSPSSRAGERRAVRARLHEHVGAAAYARTRRSRSRTRSRSSASRGPTVTVAVSAAMSITYRRSPTATPSAAPLTDRERVDAVVRADDGAVGRRRSLPGARPMRSPRNALAPAARDEAHVHALALVGGAQPELAGARAHLGLRHLADRQAACARAPRHRACRARTTGPWPDRRRARSRGRCGVSTTRA